MWGFNYQLIFRSNLQDLGEISRKAFSFYNFIEVSTSAFAVLCVTEQIIEI